MDWASQMILFVVALAASQLAALSAGLAIALLTGAVEASRQENGQLSPLLLVREPGGPQGFLWHSIVGLARGVAASLPILVLPSSLQAPFLLGTAALLLVLELLRARLRSGRDFKFVAADSVSALEPMHQRNVALWLTPSLPRLMGTAVGIILSYLILSTT